MSSVKLLTFFFKIETLTKVLSVCVSVTSHKSQMNNVLRTISVDLISVINRIQISMIQAQWNDMLACLLEHSYIF